MAQGDALPARATQNVTREYWVDPVSGSNSYTEAQARDNPSFPWQTLQKADDTISNPSSGDVAINLVDSGIHTAADNTGSVCEIGIGTVPDSDTRWIFRPAEAGTVPVVQRSGGSNTVDRWCFRIRTGGYVILENLEMTDPAPRATTGSASAVWIGGAGAAPGCEIYGCSIHDMDTTSNTTRVQGIDIDNVGGGTCIVENTRVYDMAPSAEPRLCHGCYVSAGTTWFINCLFYNISNGYGMQFFSGTPFPFKIAHCTVAGPYYPDEGPLVYVADASMNSDIRNSVFWETGTSGGQAAIHRTSGITTGTGSFLDYVMIRNADSLFVDTDANWTQSNMNEGTANPGFVDEANDDYRPTAGSAMVTMGANTSWSRPYDINGDTRPAGQETAGAFQVEADAGEAAGTRALLHVGV